MGYSLEIYCEPDVFHNKHLTEELERRDPLYPCIGLKEAYYFFGNYRCYYEESLIYLVCNEIDSKLYDYLDPLPNYQGLPDYLDEQEKGFLHDIEKIEQELRLFRTSFSNIDRKKFLHELEADLEDKKILNNESIFGYPRGLDATYFIRDIGLIESLEKSLLYIDFFKRYGAQKVMITYG